MKKDWEDIHIVINGVKINGVTCIEYGVDEQLEFERNFAKLIKSDFGVLIVNVDILENSCFLTWPEWYSFVKECLQ